jgi:type II secretory pathway pseudopilin PulG
MKKFVLLLAVMAIAAMAFAATASASTSWPATCKTMRCVNNHLNNLDSRQRASSQKISTLKSDVANLSATVDTLSNRLSATNTKLSCIVGRTIWQNYTYDWSSSYFQFLNFNHTYVGGGGQVDGPFNVLFESSNGNCPGTF